MWPPLSAPLVDERTLALETMRNEAKVGMGIGVTMFVLGEALALGHALDVHTPASLYELTPVVGPAIGLFHDQPDTPWATGLVFASWFEAAGIVVMAAAGAALAETHHAVDLEASIDGHGGTFGVHGKF